ncbi:SH3 domain-containing protein [Bacillus sp. 31A1R]|uniref:SH3 domain-containing protein n=1 Tax=Robertmurraya mangrovi TaxID=3098077 RepID=A0ABU5ITD0_9BACI|nr:SH3 domain-containing protein [Bacillus sp. 31A1R]MDZ5470405.1 SH3 domain-containing protein [Bacillus sp. 31A1R]
MKKSIVLKLTLVLVLMISLFLPYSTTTTNAASKETATVNVKAADVREKASIKSKKLGTLKKGTKVTVYEKTKSGWSKINYKKQYAYVVTKSLEFTSKKQKESYLMDTKRTYVYKLGIDKNYVTLSYGNKNKNGYNLWTGKDIRLETHAEWAKETSEGLFFGLGDINAPREDVKYISYPIKVGKTWSSFDLTFHISSINKTIKTQAGTFKNVIEVECYAYDHTDDEVKHLQTYYFAKNIGIIKLIDSDKNMISELVKISEYD